MTCRAVHQVLPSEESEVVPGFRKFKSIGCYECETLDPFLMVNEYIVRPPSGYPDHPHRGLTTLVYVLEGAMRHESCHGSDCILKAGDVLSESHGKGSVHCHMPGMNKDNHAIEIWLNMSGHEKMDSYEHQVVDAKDIKTVRGKGFTAQLIAGELLTYKGALKTKPPLVFMDITLEAGTKFTHLFPINWTVFAYVLQGTCHFGPLGSQGEKATAHMTVVMKTDGMKHAEAKNRGQNKKCRFLMLAAEPSNEPIVLGQGANYCGFVSVTEDDLKEAKEDFANSENGFEEAQFWRQGLLGRKQQKSVKKSPTDPDMEGMGDDNYRPR